MPGTGTHTDRETGMEGEGERTGEERSLSSLMVRQRHLAHSPSGIIHQCPCCFSPLGLPSCDQGRREGVAHDELRANTQSGSAVESQQQSTPSNEHEQMRKVMNPAVASMLEHSVTLVSNAISSAFRYWLQLPEERLSVGGHLLLPKLQQVLLGQVHDIPVIVMDRMFDLLVSRETELTKRNEWTRKALPKEEMRDLFARRSLDNEGRTLSSSGGL